MDSKETRDSGSVFIRDSHRFCVLFPAINRWLSLV